MRNEHHIWTTPLLALIFALSGCEGALDATPPDPEIDGGGSMNEDRPDGGAVVLDAEHPFEHDTGRDTTHPLDAGPDATADNGPDACISVEQEFLKEVYAPVLVPRCQSCHNPLGSASFTSFKLELPELEPAHVEANLAMFRNVATQQIGGETALLVKPTGKVSHGGGMVIEEGSIHHERLARFVDHVKDREFCEPQELPNIDTNLVSLTTLEHARRIGLALGGRSLTPTETEALSTGSLTLSDFTDRVMSEPAFLDIFEEGFNDTFHLLGAIDLNAGYLDERDYPNKNWTSELSDPDERSRHNRATAHAMTRAPLELMRHLVVNDLPFTGIVTADYTMVNYSSARTYDVEDQTNFDGSEDPDHFKPARLRRAQAGVDFPHAGILNTPLFLRIYSTTDTNRNRGRARVAYQFFLNTNVLEVAAEGGGDSQEVAELDNPIRDAEQCRQCHYVIDPMAGMFQNYNQNAQWRPRREGWYDDTFNTGFITSTGEVRDMPEDQTGRALQWVGEQIAADPRFPSAMVTHTYFAVMGIPPLEFPKDADQAGYLGKLHAYTLQQEWFRDVEQQFIDSNYNIKTVYRAVVLSRYFSTRRVDLNAETSDADEWTAYDGITRSVLLTPEQLQRKITAIFGEPWMLYDYDAILNTHPLPYNALLGAIDSSTLKTRPKQLTTFIGAAARVMAGEVACKLAMPDFGLPSEQRRLFPLVEPEFDETTHADLIRANIAHLYWIILGEEHHPDSEDVDALFELFGAVRQQGLIRIQNDPRYTGLKSSCGGQEDPTYSLHAWHAIVLYMLEDWAFLHQF